MGHPGEEFTLTPYDLDGFHYVEKRSGSVIMLPVLALTGCRVISLGR